MNYGFRGEEGGPRGHKGLVWSRSSSHDSASNTLAVLDSGVEYFPQFLLLDLLPAGDLGNFRHSTSHDRIFVDVHVSLFFGGRFGAGQARNNLPAKNFFQGGSAVP